MFVRQWMSRPDQHSVWRRRYQQVFMQNAIVWICRQLLSPWVIHESYTSHTWVIHESYTSHTRVTHESYMYIRWNYVGLLVCWWVSAHLFVAVNGVACSGLCYDSNSQCAGTSAVCQCKPGYRLLDADFTCKGTALCYFSIMSWGSFLVTWLSSAADVGTQCSDISDCYTRNSQCLSNKCSCLIGYTADATPDCLGESLVTHLFISLFVSIFLNSCPTIAADNLSPCLVNQDCNDPNAVCQAGRCVCTADSIIDPVDGACRLKPNMACVDLNRCLTYSHCSVNGTCQCEPGYIASGDVCKGTSIRLLPSRRQYDIQCWLCLSLRRIVR